jgi:hypothetical protein
LASQKVLRLLQAAPHARELSLELLGSVSTIIAQLRAHCVEDRVSHTTLDRCHLIGEVIKRFH